MHDKCYWRRRKNALSLPILGKRVCAAGSLLKGPSVISNTFSVFTGGKKINCEGSEPLFQMGEVFGAYTPIIGIDSFGETVSLLKKRVDSADPNGLKVKF
jgi:hypothetical protein